MQIRTSALNLLCAYLEELVKFWDDFNKPFLDNAISRGDDIVLASNPMEINRLFIDIENIPTFNSVDELSAFIKEYPKTDNLKGFGKELQHLFKNEYSYDVSKNIFIK